MTLVMPAPLKRHILPGAPILTRPVYIMISRYWKLESVFCVAHFILNVTVGIIIFVFDCTDDFI